MISVKVMVDGQENVPAGPPAEDDLAARGTVLRASGVEKGFRRGVPPRRRRIEVLKGAAWSSASCSGEPSGHLGSPARLTFCWEVPSASVVDPAVGLKS